LAKRVPGAELVSADAMAVYRGMDIGTAKPTAADQAAVPHHVLDVADSTDNYTVSRFKHDAVTAIAKVESRGGNPVMVGGSGLYVQVVVDDLTMPGRFETVRADLEATPDNVTETANLWARLRELDPVAANRMEPTNRRRIIRALEVCIGSGQPFSSFGPGIDAYPPTRFAMVGLHIERDKMDARIDARYDQQVKDGFLDEVRALRAANQLSRSAAQALGYKELLAHLDGESTLAEALEAAKHRTYRFARRQQRWFRRDPRIHWFPALAPDLVDRIETWWCEQGP